jgi:sporulation protein YlmC with PRC-barrel domain
LIEFLERKVYKWLAYKIDMLKIKKLSEVVGLKVFTDSGEFFGEVEEVNLVDNRIDGWRIRVGGSVLSRIGGARGVIIPQHFVKSIGDVFIISSVALPSHDSGLEEIPDDVM